LNAATPTPTTPWRWQALIAEYQRPSIARATWQIINTLVPLVALWVVMYLVKDVALWLTIVPAAIAGALLVRIFIILHDCGHGSFFKSQRANDVTGFLAGVLTFTPYFHWRWQHATHHRTSGQLEKRGTGDIWTLTVQEYVDASRWTRIRYRVARNPAVLLAIAPILIFGVVQRFASREASGRERRSVWYTNLALACLVLALGRVYGFGHYFFIQSISLMVAGAAGIWLFYVQHQFEDTYWERSPGWNFVAAALQGSSFYKLPRVLQWLSGNIGFHHIHHLSPRIPNYRLQQCHEANPLFQRVPSVTLLSSLRSLALRLWDEPAGKLVGYSVARQLRASQLRQ
jgi:acyl-lipid omega-6 desaturase (Delta-12 desaturase)